MQLRQRLRGRNREEAVAQVTPLVAPPQTRGASPSGARLRQGLEAAGVRAWGPYAPWMAGLLAVGLLARAPGLLAAPLDTPSAAQAALAAFVQQIGITEGRLVALPWVGPVPIDLTGGLPIYAWLTALLGQWATGQAWPGRLVSLGASLSAALLLFTVMRRLAGGRAGLFAAVFLTLSPLGLYYGRAYLPDALHWLLSLAALGAALRWRDSCMAGRPRQAGWFLLAVLTAGLALAVTPANLGLLLPLLYIVWPRLDYHPDYAQRVVLDPRHGEVVTHTGRRELVVYGLLALLPLLGWQVLVRVANTATPLDASLGGTPGATLQTLTQGSFYGLLLGQLVNNVLTILGFLLLLAGLARRARAPWPLLGHIWLGGALLGVLLQAPRLTGDEAAVLPLLPPLAAFVGLGAAWLAVLPAQVAAVFRGEGHDESDLLEAEGEAASEALVTARPARGAVRRQGWEAADPLGAQAARRAAWQRLRGALIVLGHAGVALVLALLIFTSLPGLLARYAPDPAAEVYAEAGRVVAANSAPGQRLVVAGPGAAEIFYASRLTGWALAADEFNRGLVDRLHGAGAGLLASADQAWLGRQPDYPGLLASFRVTTLDRSFIVFDLQTPPESTDRLYFWETGHTLRGGFRSFWEQNGGLTQFGYPLTEELQLPSPDDGTIRTTQVFERAVFELHDDMQQVLLAPLGRWLTHDKAPFKPIPAVPDTPERRYFPETSHSVRGPFFQTWQARGGLPMFGFPISQEVREIDPADGKVHTVQYFERARFELHPEAAGTPNEVQLGLVGKEWLEQQPLP